MRSLFLPALTALALLVGCSSEVDNKPAATVTEAPADATPPEAKANKGKAGKGKADQGPDERDDDGEMDVEIDHGDLPEGAEVFDVTVADSKIQFVGAKVTGDHTGGFEEFATELVVVDGKPSAVVAIMNLGSVYTDAEKLTKHLKSPDFFDVSKYTQATFRSTEIKAGAGTGAYTIAGTLDFHGLKKTVTFPATVLPVDAVEGGETIKAMSLKAEFTLKRSDWDVTYPGKPDDLIKDEVLVKLDMVFPTE